MAMMVEGKGGLEEGEAAEGSEETVTKIIIRDRLNICGMVFR